MTIRTGCSSALVGLHEACQALYNGDCSSAIIAGTNLILTPTMTIAMTEQGVLSPTGSCKTFDAAADGYARGEAINAIYIKRLDDAIRDGDPIRAVIRSTATNCDGKTPGIAYPSSESHEQMIRRAYRAAQINEIGDTAYFECHGTGTAVGDPLETAAIANVLDRRGTYIGSVKPNVGHSEGASGITSLIKAVLALEHKTIPPNINFSTPNPKIPFEKAKLQVPVEPTPWPEHRRQRVSVNSFGIGGANAHVVIDSAASFNGFTSSAQEVNRSLPNLLVFSGNSSDSLRRNATSIQEYINLNPDRTIDVAHTLGLRRDHLTHRAFSVAGKHLELSISNFQKARPHPPSLAFVFTGQGSQWPGVGVQLMQSFESFRRNIDMMDKVLSGLKMAPRWTIAEEIMRDIATTQIDKAEFSQPLCTAVQIGLVNLFRQWGIHPSKVVGHSSGEIAAAYAANAITAEAAIIVAYYRGQVTKLQNQPGSMAAVGLGRDHVVKYLVKGVTIACENSPQSVTLSGDTDKVTDVLASIKESSPDTFARQLRVEMAYHSRKLTILSPKIEQD
jgi:acyl transferase domain-containing protein